MALKGRPALRTLHGEGLQLVEVHPHLGAVRRGELEPGMKTLLRLGWGLLRRIQIIALVEAAPSELFQCRFEFDVIHSPRRSGEDVRRIHDPNGPEGHKGSFPCTTPYPIAGSYACPYNARVSGPSPRTVVSGAWGVESEKGESLSNFRPPSLCTWIST